MDPYESTSLALAKSLQQQDKEFDADERSSITLAKQLDAEEKANNKRRLQQQGIMMTAVMTKRVTRLDSRFNQLGDTDMGSKVPKKIINTNKSSSPKAGLLFRELIHEAKDLLVVNPLWITGTIQRVHHQQSNGKYSLQLLYCDKEEATIEFPNPDFEILHPSKENPSVFCNEGALFACDFDPKYLGIGDFVECLYQNGKNGGKWWQGRVAFVDGIANTVNIAYCDGDFECGVPLSRGKIRLLAKGSYEANKWLVGAKVDGKCNDGLLDEAQVVEVFSTSKALDQNKFLPDEDWILHLKCKVRTSKEIFYLSFESVVTGLFSRLSQNAAAGLIQWPAKEHTKRKRDVATMSSRQATRYAAAESHNALNSKRVATRVNRDPPFVTTDSLGIPHEKHKSARRDFSRFRNQESDEAKDSSVYSNPAYSRYAHVFQKRKKTLKESLGVLDLFSGIGSGTVVLKKLRIPLRKVVHVEHDPVAVNVSKFNHQNDGIDHVYISTFEEIYGEDDEGDPDKIANFIIEHGPFELVLSAAPCKHYSQVNAFRNKTAYTAQYLLKAGKMIKMINAIQKEYLDVKNDIMFLSENVVFPDNDAICKCYGDSMGGLCPIELDACDFSPCKRKRFYWTNIQVNSIDPIKQVAAHVPADYILDEGFVMMGRIVASKEEKEAMVIKANTFMASRGRIDDGRMITAQQDGQKYVMKTYSVKDREKMIGLPPGYIRFAMKNLFQKLTSKGLLKPEEVVHKTGDKDCLEDASLDPFRSLNMVKRKDRKISAPLEGKKEFSFYDEEEYSKHLIGNGWSIPVVEHLLQPLTELFVRNSLFKTYDNYNYDFPWEPYASKSKLQDPNY